MDTPAKVELLLELMKFSDAQLRRELRNLEKMQEKIDERQTILRESNIRVRRG